MRPMNEIEIELPQIVLDRADAAYAQIRQQAAQESPGMGVHNASRHLNQFSNMSGQKHCTKSQFRRHIDRLTDKITAFHTAIKIISIGLLHEIQSIISR